MTDLCHARRDWVAVASAEAFATQKKHYLRAHAKLWGALAALRCIVKPLVEEDKAVCLEDIAAEAACASARGDLRTTFAMVRCLAGSQKAAAPCPMKRVDGKLTTGETEPQ